MDNNLELVTNLGDDSQSMGTESAPTSAIINEKSGNCGNEELMQNEVPISQKNISRRDLFASIDEYLKDAHSRIKKTNCEKNIVRWFDKKLDLYPAAKAKYRILIVYSEEFLDRDVADAIHNALAEYGTRGRKDGPIMLILHSSGGYPGHAYLIGKMLQEASSLNLDIVVPRWAKSAATLLCCSAMHIHMGRLSELGPIDPQVGEPPMPALGLKVAIEHIVDLVEAHPQSKDLFVGYMIGKVDPMHLGYFDRASASAMQYAERLLTCGAHKIPFKDASEIAGKLVHGYMDHGFVIDKDEALQVFGDKMILYETEEYALADMIYNELRYIDLLARRRGFHVECNGSIYDGLHFRKGE